MNINVVNKHHGVSGIYIGRGSPLGNPYRISDKCSREEAIALYKDYIINEIEKNNQTIINELNRLYNIAKTRPLNLVCFCAPKPCHGDIIKKILLGEI